MQQKSTIVITLVALAALLAAPLVISPVHKNKHVVRSPVSEAPLEAETERVAPEDPGVQQIAQASAERRSGVPVSATGTVTRILPDDLNPPRHQKFLVGLSNGQTVLISHNIDLAPRINVLQLNTPIAFKGDFEWNEKGGVVHWTHHDPDGSHEAGWINYGGQYYQ
ncbi:MAG: DUF3465 domain-containing protein [Candidatus Hydrogenedentes bacterium]|nr:DUF3465 domain-containing protein [Candidatus Hydrogenedentota bacterium]